MRRVFLTTTLMVAAAAMVFGLQDRSRGQLNRITSAAAPAQLYNITLEGKPAGWAQSPNPKLADSRVAPSQVKVIIKAGAGMSKDFYDWIRASFNGKHVTKSGVVHACNVRYESMSIREFTDAVVSEVTFPALDGSSKDPAYMTVKLDAERIRNKPGDGSKVQGKIAPATKKWQCSNFQVEIGGLPCERVIKVDAITWKVVTRDRLGSAREPTRTVETQNINLTLPMRDWNAWREAAMRSLRGGPAVEKGSIFVMSDPTAKSGYILSFTGISIVAISVQAGEANKEELDMFVVELHANEIDLDFVRP